MITNSEFIEKTKTYFHFLNSEFDFELLLEKNTNSDFYELRFENRGQVISISHENIEDYLLVVIFILHHGQLPDYDDKTRTLHLARLNAAIMPLIAEAEIERNAAYFSQFKPVGPIEKRLLKAAKELRLCLPHLDKIM